jgi:hypothetical protein
VRHATYNVKFAELQKSGKNTENMSWCTPDRPILRLLSSASASFSRYLVYRPVGYHYRISCARTLPKWLPLQQRSLLSDFPFCASAFTRRYTVRTTVARASPPKLFKMDVGELDPHGTRRTNRKYICCTVPRSKCLSTPSYLIIEHERLELGPRLCQALYLVRTSCVVSPRGTRGVPAASGTQTTQPRREMEMGLAGLTDGELEGRPNINIDPLFCLLD